MLLTLAIAFWAGWLVAKLVPDTRLGRACQEVLIDRPAAWTTSMSPRRLASLVFSGAIMAIAVVYLAPVLSGEVALLLAGDALAYVEILSAVVIVAIRSGRVSSLIRQQASSAARPVASTCTRLMRSRQQRTTVRRPRGPASRDEDEPAWALA